MDHMHEAAAQRRLCLAGSPSSQCKPNPSQSSSPLCLAITSFIESSAIRSGIAAASASVMLGARRRVRSCLCSALCSKPPPPPSNQLYPPAKLW
mmetsp:Transcript_100971/g.320506  ORF Transcript_100971/g.320506 Transcript_100971/m.320506 type:complete len:94 (+) Transcript_100971:31-312(+)